MSPEFSPLHDDLDFLSPLSDERADELASFVANTAKGTVLDLGCGWADLLVRVLEQGPGLAGIGIDADGESIAHGRLTAQRRGVGDRLTLMAADVKEQLPEDAGAVLCVGASHIWGPDAEAKTPIDYASALRAIRGLLEPGMPAVFGETIWTAEPTPDAIAPLAGRVDEFVFLPELLDVARESGFLVMRTHEASLDEWDRFESGFTAGYVRWLTTHPKDHPDAEGIAAKLATQTDAYFRGYRNIMGMAYLQLLAA